MVGRVGVLFQIEFRKAREFPSLSISGIRGRNLLRLFRRGGILLLLEELKRVRSIGGNRSAPDWVRRLHVEQRGILIRSRRRLWFRPQQSIRRADATRSGLGR